jgi:hypothetical protein
MIRVRDYEEKKRVRMLGVIEIFFFIRELVDASMK